MKLKSNIKKTVKIKRHWIGWQLKYKKKNRLCFGMLHRDLFIYYFDSYIQCLMLLILSQFYTIDVSVSLFDDVFFMVFSFLVSRSFVNHTFNLPYMCVCVYTYFHFRRFWFVVVYSFFSFLLSFIWILLFVTLVFFKYNGEISYLSPFKLLLFFSFSFSSVPIQ